MALIERAQWFNFCRLILIIELSPSTMGYNTMIAKLGVVHFVSSYKLIELSPLYKEDELDGWWIVSHIVPFLSFSSTKLFLKKLKSLLVSVTKEFILTPCCDCAVTVSTFTLNICRGGWSVRTLSSNKFNVYLGTTTRPSFNICRAACLTTDSDTLHRHTYTTLQFN